MRQQFFKRNNTGFTLIELLVVMSIISLLSSVILASLRGARDKAENASVTASIRQYRTVLEMYASEHDSYPIPGNITGWDCVGTGYPGGVCGFNDNPTPESPPSGFGLNTFLQAYTTTVPADLKVRRFNSSGRTYVGVRYSCVIGTSCTSYVLMWLLSGSVTNCGNKGVPTPTTENTTLCSATLP